MVLLTHILEWSSIHIAHLFAFLFVSSEALGSQKKFRAKGIGMFILIVLALAYFKIKEKLVKPKTEEKI